MPSTYSSLLRLELQATGENASTWGDKANTVFQRLEEGITGVLALAIGTSVSSPVSLTYNNGSSDQARNAVLNVTGQLASSVPIHVSAVAKKYWIFNQTSGSSLQFGVAGRAAVTLASGWNHIVTDGSASFLTYSPPSSATSAVTEASADSRYAHKASVNTFTAQNTFQASVLVSAPIVFSSLVTQTAPITSPPIVELYTNTPAFASVTIGGIFFSAQDLVATKVTAVAGVQGYIESAAALSVQSRLDFITKTSNTSPRRVFSMGKGFFAVSASGGDYGLGTVNATGIFIDGSPVMTSATLPSTITGTTQLRVNYHVSSSTWTVPSAVSTAEVWCIGGGGGGGGGTTSDDKAGGGGGGGGTAYALISVTPGESLTITVGTSGAGGNTSGSSGSSGGTTEILRSATPLCRATGGSGGTGATTNSPNAGGAGGVGTIGDLLIKGGAGGYGYPIGIGGVIVAGRGGSSTHGGAPPDYISATRSNGSDGSNYGGGGNGAAADSGGGSTGGNGAPGCMIIRWLSS